MGIQSQIYNSNLWEFNKETCSMKKAEWERSIEYDGKTRVHKAKIVNNKNCIYFYALDRKQAERKALKYIKELNLKPVRSWFRKQSSQQ